MMPETIEKNQVKHTRSDQKSQGTPKLDREYVILVDEKDNEIGLAEKLVAHQLGQLHRAFSVLLFRLNSEQQIEILLQKRAIHKYHTPGLWSNACCSHPRQFESVEQAGQRRLQEELGFQVPLVRIGAFCYRAVVGELIEHEYDHVLVGKIDSAPENYLTLYNESEVAAVAWFTMPDLARALKTNPQQFTPWLGLALKLLVADPQALRKILDF